MVLSWNMRSHHCRADSLDEDFHLLWEYNIDGVGERGEGFLHLQSCLIVNLSLLSANVSLLTIRKTECWNCLQLKMNSKCIISSPSVRNNKLHSFLRLCLVRKVDMVQVGSWIEVERWRCWQEVGVGYWGDFYFIKYLIKWCAHSWVLVRTAAFYWGVWAVSWKNFKQIILILYFALWNKPEIFL